jgi:hypothetical protein
MTASSQSGCESAPLIEALPERRPGFGETPTSSPGAAVGKKRGRIRGDGTVSRHQPDKSGPSRSAPTDERCKVMSVSALS